MSFASQILVDLSVFFNADEFADSVTYNGAALSAVFIPDEENRMQLKADASQAYLIVKVSDLASAPAYRDVIVINGNTWYAFRDTKDRAEIIDGVYMIPIIRGEKPRLF